MTIYEALVAKFADKGVPPEVAIRQETNLNQNQVGEESLDDVDAFVARQIKARVDAITGTLIVAAGRYAFPMSAQDMASAWPTVSLAQRENTHRIIVELAAESVYHGAKGDLFGRAAPRSEAYANERDYHIGNPKYASDKGQAGVLETNAVNMLKTARQVVVENPTTANQLTVARMVSPSAGRCWTEHEGPRGYDPLREPWEGLP